MTMQPNVAKSGCSGMLYREKRNMINRRTVLGAMAAALSAGAARAHHGWSWAEDSNFELTGVIKSAKLGNPHGILKVAAKRDGRNEEWTVEVGQPWRNERAGLKDSMLAKGVELTIQGNRAKDPKLKVMKAARVIIKGQVYKLYPERS
jgi:hypothetical protein